MNCWAILPVKSLTLGKSRLSAVLGAEHRAALNRRLFGRVLEATQSQFGADRIAVVTADAFLLALVRAQGLHGLDDPGEGLNAALTLASRYALQRGAEGIVILSSDLPLVTPGDVAAITEALGEGAACVIAPDEEEQGTNALALSPPDAEFFRFGDGSFQRHLQAARADGRTVRILRRVGLAYDLDTPDSYRRYAKGELAVPGVPA
jgi:2-phospho-L-lactate guanylyltransferase